MRFFDSLKRTQFRKDRHEPLFSRCSARSTFSVGILCVLYAHFAVLTKSTRPAEKITSTKKIHALKDVLLRRMPSIACDEHVMISQPSFTPPAEEGKWTGHIVSGKFNSQWQKDHSRVSVFQIKKGATALEQGPAWQNRKIIATQLNPIKRYRLLWVKG